MRHAVSGGLCLLVGLIHCGLVSGCTRQAKPGQARTVDRGVDSISAMAVVNELTGAVYAGRQAGSVGNYLAGDYLTGLLTGLGLDVQTMEFAERVPVAVRAARFELVAPDGGVRALAFRDEYREVAYGAWVSEAAEGPVAVLAQAADEFEPGSIVILPGQSYDHANDVALLSRGAVAVLLFFEDAAAHRRATYPGQAPGRLAVPRSGLIKFVLSEDVRPLLVAAQADGTRLRLVNPLGFADVSCRNLWSGWNGDGGDFRPRLLIVAHLDHIGTEYDGRPFPGGLDNASGAGLALSLVENFVRDQVAMDLAVLLTDAEEVNLSGATAFVRQPPFPLAGLAVLNLDMVGGVGLTRLSVYSNGDAPSLELAERAGAALSAAGIEARSEYQVYNVDSGPFGSVGARAITFCEWDQSVYHRTTDDASNVSAAELEALEAVLYDFARGL